ncbi:MAG TPA: YbhB/YbcL family Raf kinase inhibitor-like protein [Phycisphaerae bacterium]|nr:YbhB/YbcL family Raf kinase inhibitor-like protein [Phycisphaerae bacterium]
MRASLRSPWRGRAMLAAGLAAVAVAAVACDHPTKEPVMTFTLTSPAFQPDARIPKPYTGEGDDTSPPLEWSAPPEGTRSFALVCDDPDAPAGTWDHWIIWNIPADYDKLPAGVSKTEQPADFGGAVQGKNSWPRIGYNGPMPPPGHGTHHYHFVLYALDTILTLTPGARKADLLTAMKDHVLGEARLTGVYSR